MILCIHMVPTQLVLLAKISSIRQQCAGVSPGSYSVTATSAIDRNMKWAPLVPVALLMLTKQCKIQLNNKNKGIEYYCKGETMLILKNNKVK